MSCAKVLEYNNSLILRAQRQAQLLIGLCDRIDSECDKPLYAIALAWLVKLILQRGIQREFGLEPVGCTLYCVKALTP